MGLIKCPECGSDVSALAQACPKCGYPINNSQNANEVVYSDKNGKDDSSEFSSFPELPTVMNVGKQITNWKLDCALQDCYYDPSANHTNYLEEGTADVLVHTNGICITRGLTFFYISYQQIIDMKFVSQKQLAEVDKSVLGRAVVGGLLLGPLGAVVGGLSGVGTKKKNIGDYYLVINYYDVYEHNIQSLLISCKFECQRFIDRCMSEKNANNTPEGNNYVFNLLDNNGKLSDARVLEALKVIGEMKLAMEMKKIKLLQGPPIQIIREIGKKNSIDTKQYKSSGCLTIVLLVIIATLLAACSFLN